MIKVFVGGTEEHDLPIKVLEQSILTRTNEPCTVYSIHEELKARNRTIPVPRDKRQRPVTSFSFHRFMIPELCSWQGKGIYLDSDQLVQHDIAEMWNTPFPDGANVLTTGGWQSAVMLIDCEKARWNIDDLVDKMNRGEMGYRHLMNLRHSFASVAGALDPRWNCKDKPEPNGCFLMHYTHMRMQPWLTIKHPYGPLWVSELRKHLALGTITNEDVLASVDSSHVRPSLAILAGRDVPGLQEADRGFVFPDDRRKGKR